MIDFDFVSPTKIFFGRGKEAKAGEVLRSYGAKNVLIVYGSDRVRMSGLLGTVEASILSNGISYRELNGIRPNPTAEKVREGVALARKEEVDYVLAIGGGSVIDTAKAISVGFYYDGDPFDFNLKKSTPEKALPIGVVLTISSAGSATNTAGSMCGSCLTRPWPPKRSSCVSGRSVRSGSARWKNAGCWKMPWN